MKKNKRIWLLLAALLLAVLIFKVLSPTESAVAPGASAEPELVLVTTAPAVSSVPHMPTYAAPQETPAAEASEGSTSAEAAVPTDMALPAEDGIYTTKEDVALYLHTYGHLPSNFITKTKARAAGWEGGSLEKVLPGMCIGGGGFNNLEGSLPDAKGRTWKECDINTLGAKSRGPERLVYSNDGLIYYTGDHYESFELLYGNP